MAFTVLTPYLGFDQEETAGGWLDELFLAVKEQIPTLALDEEKEQAERLEEDEETSAAIIKENEQVLQEETKRENQLQAEKEENRDDISETEKEDDDAGQGSETAQTEPAVAVIKKEEISVEQLQDYHQLLNQFFVVDQNTSALPSQINADSLLGRDMTLEKQEDQPQILIYHTHSQEEYADSIEGDESTTVIGVGDYLEQILTEQYGYQVIHVKDTFDMVDGYLERSKAYNYAEPVISGILEENPSVEVVIDLHRDGVDENKHLVTEINGKQTAKIMFFNGLCRTNKNGDIDSLPNPYIEDNLAFSFQLEYLAKQYYPDFTRCIYLKGYRYNLHLKPRSLLLEVGAQTNTVEEAKNAMEPFADLLNKVLQGREW